MSSVQESFNKIEKFLETLYYKNDVSSNDAEELFRKEYKEIGKGFCKYCHIKSMMHYIFSREIISTKPPDKQVFIIKKMFNEIKNCDIEEFKNGTIIHFLKFLIKNNIVTIDLEFSKEITFYVTNLSRDERIDSYTFNILKELI